MYKGKVIKYILCKIDGREYQVGEEYTSPTLDRIQELTQLGYLENEDTENVGVAKKSSRKRVNDNAE